MINSYYSETWKLASFTNFQLFQFKIGYNDNNNKNNIDGAFVLRIILIHSSIFFLPCQAVFTAHFILKRFSTSHLSVCHIAFVQNWVLVVETSLFPFRKS